MRYIQISSLVMFGTLVALGYLTSVFITEYSLLLLMTLCVLYMLFQIAFQGSYVFYSAFMQNFEDSGSNKDQVSSYGMGLGQLGNAVSIGLMGAFVVGGTLTIWGVNGKSLALVLGAALFIVLSLPFLLQKLDRSGGVPKEERKRFSLRTFIGKVFGNKKLFYYLLGYMLVTDSISTLQVYLTLYLKQVFGFTEQMSSMAGVLSLGMLFATCMFLGALATKVKNKNKMLAIGGVIYMSAYLLFGLAPAIPFYAYLSLAFAGVAYGLFFPLARSLYSDIVPKDEQAEYFSSFIIFERAATVVGPIVWVIVFELLNAYPLEYRYRGNVMVLSLIAMFGLYFIRKSFTIKNPLSSSHEAYENSSLGIGRGG
jgi:UMF1 family MFS transporter